MKSSFLTIIFLISMSSFADTYRSRNHEWSKTKVDSNVMTECRYPRVLTGMSAGFGHSSNYNTPHTLRCSVLKNNSDNSAMETSRDCREMNTEVDSNDFTYCPTGYVVVGLKGGYGHSSNYNTPHAIKCCKLANTFIQEEKEKNPGVDNNNMTNCDNGYAIIALQGGYGHSSNHNAPHRFKCGKLEK